MEITLYLNGYEVDAVLEPADKRLGGWWLHRNVRRGADTRELKASLSKFKYSGTRDAHRVPDNHRNRIQLALLQGKQPPELARYDAPLQAVEPRRWLLGEHQRDMLSFLLTRRRCILAAEMRCGKTLATIEAMEAASEGNPSARWLWVAPAKVIPGTQAEFAKWGATVQPQFCSYSGLTKLLQQWDGPAPLGVVFDESSLVKGASNRTKAAQHVADAVREEHDGYVWLLTGTPSPLSPCDVWSQAEIACPGFLRESSRGALEERVGIWDRLDVGDRTVPKLVRWRDDEVELLHSRLSGLMQVWFLKDCRPDVPPLKFKTIDLEPSDEAKRLARIATQDVETAVQALTIARTISDGFIYQGDVGEREALRCDCPKDQALRDLLNSGIDRILIGAAFKASVNRCVDVCREAGWDVVRLDGRGYRGFGIKGKPHELLAEFDARTRTPGGRPLAMVCHPASGGMGLTLDACPIAVAFSNTFSGQDRFQFEARIRSPENPDATFYDLIHLKTDGLVLSNLRAKRARQDVVLGVPLSEVLDALS